MTFSQAFQAMRLVLAGLFLMLAAMQPATSFPNAASARAMADVVASGAVHAHVLDDVSDPDGQRGGQSCCDVQCVFGQVLPSSPFELAAPASSRRGSSLSGDMAENAPSQLVRPPNALVGRS